MIFFFFFFFLNKNSCQVDSLPSFLKVRMVGLGKESFFFPIADMPESRFK